MKHTSFFLLLGIIVLQLSCKKDDNSNENKDYKFKIGFTNDSMNYVDLEPDKSIGSPYYIDFNNDTKTDLAIWASSNSSPSGHLFSTGINISDSTFQVIMNTDSISPKIVILGDTISNNEIWAFKSKWPNEGFIFAKDYSVIFSDEKVDYTYWLNKTGFICLRNEYKKGLFKYGWIKIKVGSYDDVTLCEYAFMK